MAYTITQYTKDKAKNLGLTIRPSTRRGKKIDVFDKSGKKLASVGAKGYKDYPTYLILEQQGLFPKGYAEKRRNLYKKRHKKHRRKKNTPSWYADQLLW